MPGTIQTLLEQNQRWSAARRAEDPAFFERLCDIQRPEYLWIGCSDSRVPANQIVDLQPGELFVHRNVANVVAPGDPNCLSVLQYAVEVLRVRHIIVCGHYGCGGILAAMEKQPVSGALGHWLDSIEQVYERHRGELDAIADPHARARRLCECNVADQAQHVTRTTSVLAAWRGEQELTVHGWIYDLGDGLLHEIVPPARAAAPEPRSGHG